MVLAPHEACDGTWHTCPDCGGDGAVFLRWCNTCDGQGGWPCPDVA